MKALNVLNLLFVLHCLHFVFVQAKKEDSKDNPICFSMHTNAIQVEEQKNQTADSFSQTPVFKPLTTSEYKKLCTQVVAWDLYCRQTYFMNACAYENMMHLGYQDFISKILSNPNYSNEKVKALWNEYLNRYMFKRKENVQHFTNVIEKALQKRDKEKQKNVNTIQAKIIVDPKYAQEQQQNCKICAEEISLKFCNEELQFLQQAYALPLESETLQDVLHLRQAALEQTLSQNFQTHEQNYILTAQTKAYLQHHDINSEQYSKFSGTALQQQLHHEICDIFDQAALLQQKLLYHSDFLLQSILLADASYDANQIEQIQVSALLNDLSFALLNVAKEYGQAICCGLFQGVQESLHAFVHPIETIQSVGKAAYFVLETLALNAYAETYGFEDLFVPLRDQRNAEIIAGLKNLGNSIANSSGPQRVQALVSFSTNFFVSGKILKIVGSTLGVLESSMSQINPSQNLVAVASDGSVICEIANDTVQIMHKMESIAQEKIAQEVSKKLSNAEAQLNKSITVKNQNFIRKPNAPPAVDTRCMLEKNLEIVEEISKEAVRTRCLPDGRIRYYKKETLSSTLGETRSFSYVLEYDPIKGIIRGWYEGYTHAGKVNRVHPKMINGKDIVSLHYPHTEKEKLMLAAQKIKDKK